MDLYSIVSRNTDVLSEALDGEVVLLVPDDAYTLALNRTGACIWALIDGQHTLAEVADAVATDFEVDQATACIDVLDFVAQLAQRDLVRIAPP